MTVFVNTTMNHPVSLKQGIYSTDKYTKCQLMSLWPAHKHHSFHRPSKQHKQSGTSGYAVAMRPHGTGTV
jgi:hypothetical protein